MRVTEARAFARPWQPLLRARCAMRGAPCPTPGRRAGRGACPSAGSPRIRRPRPPRAACTAPVEGALPLGLPDVFAPPAAAKERGKAPQRGGKGKSLRPPCPKYISPHQLILLRLFILPLLTLLQFLGEGEHESITGMDIHFSGGRGPAREGGRGAEMADSRRRQRAR